MFAFLAFAFTSSSWAGCSQSQLAGTWNYALVETSSKGVHTTDVGTVKVDGKGALTGANNLAIITTVTSDCFINATFTESGVKNTWKGILSRDKRSWFSVITDSKGSVGFFTAYKK